jgi:phage repressor protein C with HTH and peptisase S24 domain
MFMIEFWSRVETLRRTINLTRKELSASIEVSSKTMDNWVARNIIPSGDKCYSIAQALTTTVEFLFSGNEFPLAHEDSFKDSPIVSEAPVFYAGQGKTLPSLIEEPTILVPIAPQRISARPGEDFSTSPGENIGHVRILERMARGLDPERLVAAIVKGDSMTGVQIFSGDVIIFAREYIDENGIYVISLYGELKVKRLEFRTGEQMIFIHSENTRYSTEEIPMTNENLVILGKVVGWVHCHPY